jgi:hypothetical protein
MQIKKLSRSTQVHNLSVNVTAQSCALGSLHACGIPAARYLQR